MRIIYVHHALRDTGNPPTQDDKIKPLGIQDAKITAQLLTSMKGSYNFKAIYTSPYYRCAKTAQLINEHIQVPIYEEPRFNELQNVFKFVNGEKTNTSSETWKECQIRIREAIKDIVFKYDDKDIVVCVTSGINIAAFISLAFKITPSDDMPYPIVPSCSPIGFEIDKSCF